MTVKLLAKHHLEFLSLKGGCTGSPESTIIKMPLCWKAHVAAQIQTSNALPVIIYTIGTVDTTAQPCKMLWRSDVAS